MEPSPDTPKEGAPRKRSWLWAVVLASVLLMAFSYQWSRLASDWPSYMEALDALRACPDNLCAVAALDGLLGKLNRGAVIVYFFLFALFEAVPVVNGVLRVAGCVLFPVFGQVLLPVRHVWLYMGMGAMAMVAGAHFGPGYGEYAFGGALSATVMVARLLVLREKSPWQGAVWGLISGRTPKGR